jgi:hypothetical protein
LFNVWREEGNIAVWIATARRLRGEAQQDDGVGVVGGYWLVVGHFERYYGVSRLERGLELAGVEVS